MPKVAREPTRGAERRVNVLHVLLDGDTSGFFPQIAKHHDRSRFKVTLATLRPTDTDLALTLDDLSVEHWSVGCRSRVSYPVGLLRLVRQLRRNQTQILHAHLLDPAVVGLLAGTAAGVPVRVLTRHYSDYHTRIHKRWHVALDRLCTRLAHAVIAVSNHTADHLVTVEGAPAQKVHAIPNGIDFERCARPSSDQIDALRRELGAEGAHLVVTVGRLHPEKGYPCMIEALPGICRALAKPLIWAIAGEGPFKSEFRRRVAQTGCEASVRFLGFRRDVPALVTAADLLVLPSVAEAFGLVLAEALWLGTPVVTTYVGGIPEIVRDGVEGLVVPPGDAPALGAAVAHLLQSPATMARMRGAGAERVRRAFDFSRMLADYEALYETLLAARSVGHT